MTEQVKHTPGPWEVIDKDTIAGPGGNVVAECCGYSENARDKDQRRQGGREANARLIASAPDLLELVKLAMPYVGVWAEGTGPRKTDAEKWVADARAAIAKATGTG